MPAHSKNLSTLNADKAIHDRFRVVCNALGLKHHKAANEAITAWIDAHELEALEAMAAQVNKVKKSEGD